MIGKVQGTETETSVLESFSSSGSFCLDHAGDDSADCYDIQTSCAASDSTSTATSTGTSASTSTSTARRLQDCDGEWTLSISAKQSDGSVIEAVKEGSLGDDVKVLCGRLFKKLGRYAN